MSGGEAEREPYEDLEQIDFLFSITKIQVKSLNFTPLHPKTAMTTVANCEHFQKKTGCKFGDKCKYPHLRHRDSNENAYRLCGHQFGGEDGCKTIKCSFYHVILESLKKADVDKFNLTIDMVDYQLNDETKQSHARDSNGYLNYYVCTDGRHCNMTGEDFMSCNRIHAEFTSKQMADFKKFQEGTQEVKAVLQKPAEIAGQPTYATVAAEPPKVVAEPSKVNVEPPKANVAPPKVDAEPSKVEVKEVKVQKTAVFKLDECPENLTDDEIAVKIEDIDKNVPEMFRILGTSVNDNAVIFKWMNTDRGRVSQDKRLKVLKNMMLLKDVFEQLSDHINIRNL